MDSRITALETLLTGPKLLAGAGAGPCRCCHAARIIGVPLQQKPLFYAWLEAEGLLLAPISVFWHESPLAGCVELDNLRKRLQAAIYTGERLTFDCIHLPQLRHGHE
jgi:hypothetical protein